MSNEYSYSFIKVMSLVTLLECSEWPRRWDAHKDQRVLKAAIVDRPVSKAQSRTNMNTGVGNCLHPAGLQAFVPLFKIYLSHMPRLTHH